MTAPASVLTRPSRRERFADWAFGAPLDSARPFWAVAVVVLMMFAAGIAVTILRLPADQRNVLWAEDGNQFLADALRGDYLSNLFTPYAGYMHLIPRTAAQLVATFVPIDDFGIAMNLLGAAVWSTVALAAFVFTRDRIQPPLRWLLWALVLLLPIGSMEVATNVSNSHWFLMFGLFIALSARTGTGVPRAIFACALVVAAVLSDPLSLLFAPLVVARVVALPRLRENLVSIAFAAAGILQLIVDAGTSRDRGSPELVPGSLGATYLVRVVWGDLVGALDGSPVYNDLGRTAVVAMAGAFVVVLAVFIVIRWRRAGLAVIALVGSAGFYGVVAVLTWEAFGKQLPGVEVYWGGRYLVVPTLLLVTAIVATLSAWLPTEGGSRGRTIARWALLIVVASLLITPGVRNFQTPAYKVGATEMPDAVDAVTNACRVDPTGKVQVAIAPPGFSFTVPCARVLGG